MKKYLLFFLLVMMGNVWGQVNISGGNTITQDFTIGTSATATLPTGWKMDKNDNAVRTVGTYSGAQTTTIDRAGNNMSSSATGTIYNFAAGDPTSATDRAVGGLSSSTKSKSVNVYVQLTNNGASAISSFKISYNVEKYRKGSNAAGFSIQMYYSTNGTDWITAGSDFLTSFSADADNAGFTLAPGETKAVTNKTLSQTLAASSSIYLAWNYSVTTGTTTSNAQALGIDDVSITAMPTEPTIQSSGISFSSIGATQFTVNWTSGNGDKRVVFLKEDQQGEIADPVDYTEYTASTDWTTPGSQLGTSGYYCIYNGNSSSVSVTNLTANKTYYVYIYEYNGVSSLANYFTANPLNGSQITANNSQNPAVSTGSPTVSVGNYSGVQQITFNNVTTGGNVLVSYFNNSPTNATYNGGTPTHVSEYRWIIEPSSSLVFNQINGYTLRFQVSDCPGINELEEGNNTALFLYKRSNHGAGEFQNCGALTYHRNSTVGNQSDDYLESALITSGFSEFVFGSPNQPLPVELTSFTAKYLSSGVVLNWQTATEINNNKFEVERQINEGNWEVVGSVLGHGNSNTVIDYTYTDNKTNTKGKYNYRLKQIDNDGTFKYTQVVNVTVGNLDNYELAQNYPNPFNPSTNINFTMPKAGNVKIVLFNALGQEVATLFNGNKDAGFHTVQFNANGLPSGIYFYQMTSEGFNQVKKMILTK